MRKRETIDQVTGRTAKNVRRAITQGTALLLALLLFSPHSLFAEKDNDLKKHYGLIFGTAYAPDDHALYGVKIQIHPAGKKHPSWELISDHRGEFAQRVPPGPADYVISGEAEYAPLENGVPQMSKKRKLKGEAKVHIEAEERQDVGLHMHE